MKLKRAITAIVLVSAFAAPVAAGTFEDAVDAHARGDYAKALRLIRPLANDGDAAAQYNLALMYMTGRGVQQDYTAAAIWLRKAAEQGYAFAQSNLGTLYRDGRGVPENDAEAVVWFRKAGRSCCPVFARRPIRNRARRSAGLCRSVVMVSESCGTRPSRRQVLSRGYVRQRRRRAAGLCSCSHVVQSIGGTG